MAFAVLLGVMGVMLAVAARGDTDLVGAGMIVGAVAVAAVTATTKPRRDDDRWA
jgi:drug/metabolite transporter (DMT)-like permease